MSTQNTKALLTEADIERAIRSEFYFTAADGVLGESQMGTKPSDATGLHRTTFCVLVLDNGARVVGINYGSIDQANHNVELGRKYAREAAVRQVWELLGFRLRDWIMAAPTSR